MKRKYGPKEANHEHNLASWQSKTWQKRHESFEERLKLAKELHRQRVLADRAAKSS